MAKPLETHVREASGRRHHSEKGSVRPSRGHLVNLKVAAAQLGTSNLLPQSNLPSTKGEAVLGLLFECDLDELG